MSPVPDPVVTVVIPTHNRADLISRAIRSVLAQTLQNFELIVVDDASTDETEDAVRSFADPRIRYLRRSTNDGNASARNLGIQQARGEFVTFLDSDDEFLPGFLDAVVDALRDSPDEVGFVWAGRELVFTTPEGERRFREKPRRLPRTGDQYVSFLEYFRGGTNRGLTVKRRCFDSVGLFDERLRAAVDTDFVLRLVQQYTYREITTPLVAFHQHSGDRVSRNSRHKAEAYSLLIEKHAKALREHRHLWTYYHHRTARLYYDSSDRSKARYHIQQALTRNPFHIKSWLLMLLCETLEERGMDMYRELSRVRKFRLGDERRG